MAKKKKKTTNKKCKVESRADKCILYEAEHKLEKACDAHIRAIKKRGGVVNKKAHPTKTAWIVEYSFPKQKKR